MPTKPRNRYWDKTKEAADYRRKYNQEHYDRIQLMVPKGTNDRISAVLEKTGMSKTTFVLTAIDDLIEKMDKEISPRKAQNLSEPFTSNESELKPD